VIRGRDLLFATRLWGPLIHAEGKVAKVEADHSKLVPYVECSYMSSWHIAWKQQHLYWLNLILICITHFEDEKENRAWCILAMTKNGGLQYVLVAFWMCIVLHRRHAPVSLKPSAGLTFSLVFHCYCVEMWNCALQDGVLQTGDHCAWPFVWPEKFQQLYPKCAGLPWHPHVTRYCTDLSEWSQWPGELPSLSVFCSSVFA
jgi:hypothetical protein